MTETKQVLIAQELVIPGRQKGEKFVWFAAGVLSEAECVEWIAMAEKRGFAPASLLADGSTKNPHRTNDRLLLFDKERAAVLTERLRPLLPTVQTTADGREWRLVGLNERLSVLRYRSSERYGRHVDVPYEDEAAGLRSFVTCQLYLNEGFRGGETRFIQEVGYTNLASRGWLDVVPKTGAVLLFEHELTHEGCAVDSGTKYTVRVDLLYRHESRR